MTLHKIVNYFYTEFDVGLFVRYVLTVGCICVLMPKEPVTPVEITAIFLLLTLVKK